MASLSQLFSIPLETGESLSFGICLNELAIHAVKLQRLLVFHRSGFYHDHVADDDDEFEPKTYYFAAYIDRPPSAVVTAIDRKWLDGVADELRQIMDAAEKKTGRRPKLWPLAQYILDGQDQSTTVGMASAVLFFRDLCGGLTSYPGEQGVPFSVEEVFDLKIPTRVEQFSNDQCFYLRTIECERPVGLDTRLPPRTLSVGLMYAAMLHARSHQYKYVYSIFKQPLWQKMKSVGLPFHQIRGEIVYEDEDDPYLFQGDPVYPVYAMVDELETSCRCVLTDRLRLTVQFTVGATTGLAAEQADQARSAIAHAAEALSQLTETLDQANAAAAATVESIVPPVASPSPSALVSKGLPEIGVTQTGVLSADGVLIPKDVDVIVPPTLLKSTMMLSSASTSVYGDPSSDPDSLAAQHLAQYDFALSDSRGRNQTAFFYHPDTVFHPGSYVEVPGRTKAVFDRCLSSGLIQRCQCVVGRPLASKTSLELVHGSDYAELICKFDESEQTLENVEQVVSDDSDTRFTVKSTFCSRLSVGGLLLVVDRVLSGVARNGAAAIRPPGHHAGHHSARGFCLVGNVAIAARHAVDTGAAGKVLIVDWDAHYGDGTAELLADDDRFMLISLHRHDGGEFYPGTGQPDMVGGPGLPRKSPICNVAWPGPGFGDADYLYAFHHLVMPLALSFGPDLVLVSAGFDSALGDPKGGLRVTPAGFASMTACLNTLAGGKLVLALEGGYDVCVTAACFEACLGVLVGDPVPRIMAGLRPKAETRQLIAYLQSVQKNHWIN